MEKGAKARDFSKKLQWDDQIMYHSIGATLVAIHPFINIDFKKIKNIIKKTI